VAIRDLEMSVRKPVQLSLLGKQTSAYGGELRKKRKGRLTARPLTHKTTMHLVLRSTRARAEWSFRRHQRKIDDLVKKFCDKYHVKLLSYANVGNHLHFHIQLFRVHLYRPFIRALTAAIAMVVRGLNRWTRDGLLHKYGDEKLKKFWDYRPYSRIVQSFRAFLNMRDYIQINRYEGFGVAREFARECVRRGEWLRGTG
jgi:hypothetical protein